MLGVMYVLQDNTKRLGFLGSPAHDGHRASRMGYLDLLGIAARPEDHHWAGGVVGVGLAAKQR